MSITLELPADLFAVAKAAPDHADPKRFRLFSEFMMELGNKCGFSEDWKTNTPPMSEEDANAIESAFHELHTASKSE